ncbi:MAG: ATP-binding cassette domain-containing protein [Ignavibacteriae bacterium]|nr:ATP-binding cassette domain-containing protein [Ignavibacteriota bacterium]NOG99881.1 ATP-binding cassette domain-containing protein [Ignavibacteriota bacterium]
MLKIKNLNKSYDKLEVLNNISFEAEPGSILGILGSNGAGKTTLLNTIAGNIEYEGEIKINGMLNHEFLKEGRSNLLLLPDNPFVYEFLTGFEFIKFIMDIQKIPFNTVEKKILLLLKLFNLEKQKDYLIKDYSHGMKHKISIIIALVQSPKVLLLDEPASGLDTTSIIALKRFLILLAESGSTIILTTHIIDLIENLCNSVIILHDTQISMHKNIYGKSKNELEKLYMDSIGSEISTLINEIIEDKDNGNSFK